MTSLGMLNSSFFSASNENTVALIAPKTEFSLVKVEAPTEFGPLGSALARPKKRAAEEGGPHRTARRLDALFEQIIPSTPKLISAYGRRVSEIINSPGVNPEGLASHGPFRDCVGADATAMWAAATSGVAAIAMYLLACFIAHTFDEKEAISIWVELVDERKREIHTQASQNNVVSNASYYGAQQEISRRDLALWDNSARSWLNSADRAKSFQKIQLGQFIENLSIPHYSAGSPYKDIIGSWSEAMLGVEHLLEGKPLESQNKSVPLGLQSWHLYPNLIVLSKRIEQVSFGDSLFVPSATLTLGAMDLASGSSLGSKWSLALSHYQYYGGIVKVQSQEDSSRVTLKQALVIALGALTGLWGCQASALPEIRLIASWFHKIFLLIRRRAKSVDEWKERCSLGLKPLSPFLEAAQLILETSDKKEEILLRQLFQFGQRRYTSFLAHKSLDIPYFFGLRQKGISQSLRFPALEECNIHYLRGLALQLKFSHKECLIYYKRTKGDPEIITALLDFSSNRTRGAGESTQENPKHTRWVIRSKALGSQLKTPHDGSSALISEYRSIGSGSESAEELRLHIKEVEKLGERVEFTDGKVNIAQSSNTKTILSWINPPDILSEDDVPFTATEPSQRSRVLRFQLLEGNQNLGLFVSSSISDYDRKFLAAKSSGEGFKFVPLEIDDSLLMISAMNGSALESYLFNILTNQFALLPMGAQFHISEAGLRSLLSLSLIQDFCGDLENATLSTKFFSSKKLLGECHWFASHYSQIVKLMPNLKHHLTNPNVSTCALACIVYVDSGMIDLTMKDLSNAVAVSRENSIFVASYVLSDPNPKSSTLRSILTRIVGNLGQSGTSVLVSPKKPLVREPGNDFRVIDHSIYDFLRENNLEGSSLHLQLTEWSFPIKTDDLTHAIDNTAQYLETVIKIRDKGSWVADLDILQMFTAKKLFLTSQCDCHKTSQSMTPRQVISLDNWEEFLDPPLNSICILRAYGNWTARLAAVCILSQKGLLRQSAIAGPEKYCLRCIERDHVEENETFYIVD